MNHRSSVLVLAALAAAVAVTAPASAGAAPLRPQHHGTGYKANPALAAGARVQPLVGDIRTLPALSEDATFKLRSTQPYVDATQRHLLERGALAAALATPVPQNNKFVVLPNPSVPIPAHAVQQNPDTCLQWSPARYYKDSFGQLQFDPMRCIKRSLTLPTFSDPFATR